MTDELREAAERRVREADSTVCPYCDYEAKGPRDEITHMNLAHPDVIAERTGEPVKPPMPNPDEKMLASPEFEAVWQAIKGWDIAAPEFYDGYMGANGSHVALILGALPTRPAPEGEYPCPRCVGTGSLESNDSTDDRWWDCPDCEGTGKLAERRRGQMTD